MKRRRDCPDCGETLELHELCRECHRCRECCTCRTLFDADELGLDPENDDVRMYGGR